RDRENSMYPTTEVRAGIISAPQGLGEYDRSLSIRTIRLQSSALPKIPQACGEALTMGRPGPRSLQITDWTVKQSPMIHFIRILCTRAIFSVGEFSRVPIVARYGHKSEPWELPSAGWRSGRTV